MDIQWYPGHMAKARREILLNLKLVDLVIELTDARVPKSSRNPDIPEIHGKPYVLVATKTDLADPKRTKAWVDFWRTNREKVVLLDVLTGKGFRELEREIKIITPSLKRTPRALIVGIPNVGKSSLINKLAGKSSTKVGAKPGITRGKQWIKAAGLQLLDTPGILWPKFADQETAYKLASVSAIRDDISDWEELAEWLLKTLVKHYWIPLSQRYKLTSPEADLLALIGSKRGCLRAGGIIDRRQAAQVVLQDFRSGRLGRISLEVPNGEDE